MLLSLLLLYQYMVAVPVADAVNHIESVLDAGSVMGLPAVY